MSASTTLTSIYPSSSSTNTNSLPSSASPHVEVSKRISAFTIDLDGNNSRQNLQEAFRKYREYKVVSYKEV